MNFIAQGRWMILMNSNTATAKLTYSEGSILEKEKLKQLGLISYGRFARVLGPENWTQLSNTLSRDSTWKEIFHTSKCFICADGAEIVGMAFIAPSSHPWQMFRAEWSYIRLVGVHPNYGAAALGKP